MTKFYGNEKPSPQELLHFGVKGMKWGIRKEDKQVRRERAAQKFESKAAEANTMLSKATTYEASKYYTKIRDRALKDAEAKRQGKLTSTQKRVIVGAAVVAAIVGAGLASKYIESGEARVAINRGRDFLAKNNKASTFKRDDSLSQWNMSLEDIESKIVKPINPDYGKIGTKNNCKRATYAYEMRRRGYDVAATKTTNGYGQTMIGAYNALNRSPNAKPKTLLDYGREVNKNGDKTLDDPTLSPFLKTTANMTAKLGFENIPIDTRSRLILETQLIRPDKKLKADIGRVNAKSIFDTLQKQPNGARGELGMAWIPGGGHSVAWEIVKGKPVIIDAQNGKLYKSAKDIEDFASNVSNVGITRLDTLPMNEEFLKRWLRNA